jgi:metal transporter CNNM
MNSIANEALPLFLHEIVSPVAALTISVTAVLIFGEILPSAIFTGPNQLAIGAAMSPIVWFFIYAFYIIAYPIAILLDALLGEEHKGRYNKAEFRALINLHNDPDDDSNSPPHLYHGGHSSGFEHDSGSELSGRQVQKSGLTRQELRIMAGALELRRIRVKDALLPLDKVFMLSMDTKLNADTLAKIVLEGHSRIPVYEGHPHNIRGMVLVKRLVVLYPEEEREVGSLALLEPHVVGTEDTLLDVLYQFCSGRSHLAIVTSEPKRVLEAIRSNTLIPVNAHMAGIITLEDIIERLIKQDIQDESDISVRSAEKVFNSLESMVDHEVVSPLVYAVNARSTIPSPVRPLPDARALSPPLIRKPARNPLAVPLLGNPDTKRTN